MPSLRQRSVSAMLWSGADVFMRQGLQFAVAVVLARLLSPEEFGTIALLYLFVGISNVMIDSGLSSALVQRQDITHDDESTVFWFGLGMGTLLFALLALAAPLIADLFAIPVLAPLTVMLALSLLINTLGSIHHTLLTKRLNFRLPMKIGLIASLISGVTAVALAAAGLGVWALAAQVLVASIVTTSLLWATSDWRPGRVFSRASFRRLFQFGGFLMVASLLDVAYNRLYTLLIGTYYGVRELGIYNRADNTKQIPIDMLSRVITRVALPIFSTAASDRQRLRRGVQDALRGMMLLNVPIMLGLAVTAEHVVRVLFGEQWTGAVPLLRILCFAGFFWPLHVINLEVLKALGYSNLFFRLEVIKKIVGLVLLGIGTYYGLMGIACSQVASSLLGSYINAYFTGRHIDYGFLAQAKDFLPVTVAASAMAAAVFLLGEQITATSYVVLPIQVMSGAVLFVAMCVVFRIKAFNVVLALLRRRD